MSKQIDFIGTEFIENLNEVRSILDEIIQKTERLKELGWNIDLMVVENKTKTEDNWTPVEDNRTILKY